MHLSIFALVLIVRCAICTLVVLVDLLYLGAELCRPRLLDFVSSLAEDVVKSASQKAFQSLPDISKAISELTVLKGVGPATASAILAAYAPEVAPFMSDEVRSLNSLVGSYSLLITTNLAHLL